MTDRGGIAVEFVLLSILVVVLAVGIMQVALSLHVRNIVLSSASAGARYAAAYDRSPADGQHRTEDLIAASLGDYPARVTVSETSIDGSGAVRVEVTAPVPVLGLWGVGSVHVSAHALAEEHRG